MKSLRYRPTSRQLYALAACLLLIMINASWQLNQLNTALLIGFAVVAAFDCWRCKKAIAIQTTLQCQQHFALGRTQSANVIIKNKSKRTLKIDISLHYSSQLSCDQAVQHIDLAPAQQAKLQFPLKALRRGEAQLQAIECRVTSPWLFWQHSWLDAKQLAIKIYPDFSLIQHKETLNASSLVTTGMKLQKKRGSGTEFHQLRDYQQSDTLRQIDWQATSKRRKLISREYQEEKNQQVIVMLDAAKNMNIQLPQGNHFDYALNALLMLAHHVLKQGDAFSMQSFNQQYRWLANVKGVQNVSRILNHFYDLYPDQGCSDYLLAAKKLLQRKNKRALVLLVTTIDEHSLPELLPALKLLQKHHLVALINIKQRAMSDCINQQITDFEDADNYCVALSMLNQYKADLKKLNKQGIICVDCDAQQLLPQLVNTYLNVKHSGLL